MNERYLDESWRQSMRVKLDFNNMMSDQLGNRGIYKRELEGMQSLMDAAVVSMRAKRPIMRWRELPYNQDEIVKSILADAASIREQFDDFVVLGIGGSALGPTAVQQALNHLHYNDLPREKRNGPRLYVEDNIDPERMAALLDVMVPVMGGWELCHRLRQITAVPIIFLTALDGVDNVVQGLEMGADDYLVKPFEQAELLARVMAHLRRAHSSLPAARRYELAGGKFVVDLNARTVWVEGVAVDLTPREFDLLLVLVEQVGHVVKTADLVDRAWHMRDEGALENVKPYIHYLRKKLEADPAAPRWIQTVRGVGYRLVAE